MTKWNYRCDEVNLNHDQMIELNKDGLLKLIIAESLEKQIVSLVKEEFEKKEIKNISSGYKLTKGKIIAFGVLCVSLYLCIIGEWAWLWGVIIAIGFIVHDIIPAGMNTENIIDLAIKDAEIFEKIKEMEGWIFQIEEGKEKEYLIHPIEEDDEDEESNEEDENLDDEDYYSGQWFPDSKLFGQWIQKRVKDFGKCISKDQLLKNEILDASELPHPKEEIILALYTQVIFLPNEEAIPALKTSTLNLADYQENVGPKKLTILESNTKRYEEFKELVDKDIEQYFFLIDLAEEMRKHSTVAQLTSIVELAKYLKSIDLEKEFDFKAEKELDLDEFGVKVEELFNFKKKQ